MAEHDEPNVHQVWSDYELDRTLATLHADVATDKSALDRTRAELIGAAGGQPPQQSTADSGSRRHWARWAVAAAAVVILVAGALVIQTVSFGGGNPPAASAAAASLNSAAAKVGASDPVVGPGQYRYIATHAWWSGTMGDANLTWLGENLDETWVPADQNQEWLNRGGPTGKYTWIHGSDAEAKAADVPLPTASSEEVRAPCGDFYPNPEEKACAIPGSWQRPKPQWLAQLPTDPQQFYERLQADAPDNARGNTEVLVYAADALRSGLVPAETRATLYRALAKLPGLEITDQLANLDGRVGIAYGISDGIFRHEIIIDPATGQFIGERETFVKDTDGLKAGTVMSYTSVSTAVVDKIGEKPAG